MPPRRTRKGEERLGGPCPVRTADLVGAPGVGRHPAPHAVRADLLRRRDRTAEAVAA